MLLKKLVQNPVTSSQLFVCDPFRMLGKEELVKEVIGLANANVEGPRYILFGVNPGGMEGSKIVGINEDAVSDLKKAHRHIAGLVEPVLSLAFIFDSFNGKIAGALEISDCDEGPFVVGEDYSKELASGKAWVRDGRELHEIDPDDLANRSAPEPAEVDDEPDLIDPNAIPEINLGFNDDPGCQLIELTIPDTSNPPFASEREENKNLRQTIMEKVSTVTTQILKLARRPSFDDDANSSTDVVKAAQDLFEDADKHYHYEERAVHLNFSICNKGDKPIVDLEVELGFPVIDDIDVADKIYASPFDKRAQARTTSSGYPKVVKRDRGVFVRTTLKTLEPNTPTEVLATDLRIAVKPTMKKRKLAILYNLRQKEQQVGDGRLKIQFGDVVS